MQINRKADPHIIRNYCLVLMVLIFEVSPFFIRTKANLMIPFFILGYYFLSRGHKIGSKVVCLILLIVLLIIIQGLIWGFSLLTVFTYIAFSILLPYFLFKVVGIKLFKYLSNIIFVTALYATILWALQNVFPAFDASMQNFKDYVFYNFSYDRWARSLIFYTVSIYKIQLSGIEIYRNSGIYHEPGAFGYWLIIGIGLNTIISGKFFDKKNICMMIALLTTFSTSAYLQLFILLFYSVWKSNIYNVLIRVCAVVLFIVVAYYAYTTLGFMEEKVVAHYETQMNIELEGARTTGRFVRVLKGFNIIQQSPIFGRGIITAAADQNHFSAFNIQGAGAVSVLAQYGLIFGLLYYLYFYRGLKYLAHFYSASGSFAVFFFAAIIVGGISQRFIFDSVTIQIFFVGLLLYKQRYLSALKNTNQKIIPFSDFTPSYV